MKIIYLAWASIFIVLAVLLNGADAYCLGSGKQCGKFDDCCSLTCMSNGECA
uniref:Venom toxin-like peptide n=1 Tax=Aphidius ervi TaxID=37627 RepID=A0A034WWW1_APHER